MPTIDQIAAFRSRVDGFEEVSLFQLRVIYLVAREINRLRDLHGLPQFTAAQVVQAIKNVDLTDEPLV